MTAPTPRPGITELAAAPLDGDDTRVLDRMAAIYAELDPVPDGLVERLQFGITLDALHAEIAELQRAGDLVGVRADDSTETQTVTFSSASLTTMVTITVISADRARIDGWVAPGAGVGVELRLVGDTLRTTADDDGRFVFADVPRGLAQLIVRRTGPGDQPPVVTPSIEL